MEVISRAYTKLRKSMTAEVGENGERLMLTYDELDQTIIRY